MKIIMYELLGMVKDGKAPKKIKYDDMIWEYDGDYYSSKNNIILEEYCNLTTSLNDEVEILEEEKKIPEKLNIELNIDDENKVNCYRATNLECDLAFKINEIIDYLKSKGE